MRMTRAAGASAAFAIAASALAGCSWRLESDAPTWPSPDAVTVTRDDAADREQAVLDALADLPASPSAGDAVLAAYEADAAPERIDALGGVYAAYPDASPDPTASPVVIPPTADAVAAARDGDLADAQSTTDDDLAFLLRSAGLSHALTAWYAQWAEQSFLDPATLVVDERVMSTDAVEGISLVPDVTQIDPATLSELVLAHDRARYLYEVMAAKAADDEREQWLARRDIHAARAEALAQLTGVDDDREAIDVVANADVADTAARVATAQATETSLADTYAALMDHADESDIPWLLGAAFDGYAQAAAFADPGAGDAVIPALPGIAPSPSQD